ncbi:(5-formylfuran-3-yl)methyl phosphate synthase [Methylobacterium trifolii]|uniref:(5-formylfuran-3-yl)methyl phosphate synthase n=1 Tax=Methylobacterium trifolii TaxID=1003092 RepID=UPI001EDEE166|nr:(5-formylfuran-3-yl)methyl phosphate synthase [Methylobacterium trifolii]
MSESVRIPSALPLPRLLVSVRDVAEARAAHAAGADLIDAKDPEAGALGALPQSTVRAIREALSPRAVTSAVAGEPEVSSRLPEAVAAMAATGVGFVKVGLRPAPVSDRAMLAAAAGAAPGRLIAVLFAEDGFAADAVPVLAEAGFCGAMVDTMGKDGRRLGDWIDPAGLSAFTAACRTHGLLCGLAGSLRIADIGPLSAHRPDYLGFRGGLCHGLDRRHALDPARVTEAVRALSRLGCRDAA